MKKALEEYAKLERVAEVFENPHRWTLTHRGVPAPELGWVDRKEWRDPYGRVIEVTRLYGSKTYRATLLSPAGGLLTLREGEDPAKLFAEVKVEARRLNVRESGESLIARGGALHLPRPSDAERRDLTEYDLALVEQVEVEKLRESKVGLPINPRLVLALVREIRRHREAGRIRASLEKDPPELVDGEEVLGVLVELDRMARVVKADDVGATKPFHASYRGPVSRRAAKVIRALVGPLRGSQRALVGKAARVSKAVRKKAS